MLFADLGLTSEGPRCNGKYSLMGRDLGADEEMVIDIHRTREPAWAKREQDPTSPRPQGRKGETLPTPTRVQASRGLGRANEPPGHPAGPLRCCYSSVTEVPPRATGGEGTQG